MVDTITAERGFKPAKELTRANGRPFEYFGIIYFPKYLNGHIQRYEGALKNLRLFMYPDKIYLCNSLHKFWHGCNYNNFYSEDLKSTIDVINEKTGINWKDATMKKIEYGCNIAVNPDKIINSLLSYKGKDFQPMITTGNKYGTSCGFEQYRVKGYDKIFQVKKVDKINLNYPLFRWEIQVTNPKYFNRFKLSLPIKVSNLLKHDFLNCLANDAIMIYENSIKMQMLHLNKLTSHEKRVVALMLNSEIRQDLRIHNKETYKRDRKIYKRIMSDKNICINDGTGELLKEKFNELIEGKSH